MVYRVIFLIRNIYRGYPMYPIMIWFMYFPIVHGVVQDQQIYCDGLNYANFSCRNVVLIIFLHHCSFRSCFFYITQVRWRTSSHKDTYVLKMFNQSSICLSQNSINHIYQELSKLMILPNTNRHYNWNILFFWES